MRIACSCDTSSFIPEIRPTTRTVSASAASLPPVAISCSSASNWSIVAAYCWMTAKEGIWVPVAALRRAVIPLIAVIAPWASCRATTG